MLDVSTPRSPTVNARGAQHYGAVATSPHIEGSFYSLLFVGRPLVEESGKGHFTKSLPLNPCAECGDRDCRLRNPSAKNLLGKNVVQKSYSLNK